MKKVLISAVCLAIFGITCSLTGTSSVSAAPADTGKGTGCYVRDANDNYYEDVNCSAHGVIKFDNDGNFQFYDYQDQGTLPAEAARPSRAYQVTFYECYGFTGLGLRLCGTINEIVTPSGEYKSSFRATESFPL